MGKVGVRITRIKEPLGGGRKLKACRPTLAPGHKAGQLPGLPAEQPKSLHFRQIKAPSPAVPEFKLGRMTVGTHPATTARGLVQPAPKEGGRGINYAHSLSTYYVRSVRRGVCGGRTACSAPARSSLYMSCVRRGRWCPNCAHFTEEHTEAHMVRPHLPSHGE